MCKRYNIVEKRRINNSEQVVEKRLHNEFKDVHNVTHRLWTKSHVFPLSTSENNLIIAKKDLSRNGLLYLST